jgi:uncharacterized protein
MRIFVQWAAMLLLSVPNLAAAKSTDTCPLATQSYSVNSPLLDLRLDPATQAILAAEAPDLVTYLTRNFGGGDLPTGFDAIVTPAWLLKVRPEGADIAMRLNAALAAVPVTTAAIKARCARYDTRRPKLPKMDDRPAILVFGKINGYRDSPSIDSAKTALQAIGTRRDWNVVFVDNGAVFNTRDLSRFDAVVWNNVSGDALTVGQRKAFRQWIETGGGFAGIHGSGGDPVWFWDWYVDTLIGARFIGHPVNPQFQNATVRIEHADHSVTAGLPQQWQMSEEWYSFAQSPRGPGTMILATLDEGTYAPLGFGGNDIRMGDHPIAWTRCIAKGRSFYTAIGHRPESYVEPSSVKMMEQGIAWAAGLNESGCAARAGGAK